jgi:hypothetical protein
MDPFVTYQQNTQTENIANRVADLIRNIDFKKLVGFYVNIV